MRLLARMQRRTIVSVGGVEAHAAGGPTRQPLGRYGSSSDGSRRVRIALKRKAARFLKEADERSPSGLAQAKAPKSDRPSSTHSTHSSRYSSKAPLRRDEFFVSVETVPMLGTDNL